MVRKFTNLVSVNRLSQYQPLCKKLWLKIHTKKIICMSKVYLPALRKNIATWYQKYTKYEIDPNNVIVGPGSKELIYSF